MERRDLIISFCSFKFFVYIFLKFSGFAPLVFIDLFKLDVVGADVAIMRFCGGSTRWEAAEKCSHQKRLERPWRPSAIHFQCRLASMSGRRELLELLERRELHECREH